MEVRPRNPDDAFTILLRPFEDFGRFCRLENSTPLEKGVASALSYYEAVRDYPDIYPSDRPLREEVTSCCVRVLDE